MFHWICPECGCEIPPSVKECPSCDPQAPLASSTVEAVAAPAPAPVAQAPKHDPVEELPLDPMLAMAEQIRAVQVERFAVVEPATPPTVPIPAVAPPVEVDLKLEPANEVVKHPLPIVPEPSAVEIALAPTNLLELAAVIGVTEIAPPGEPVPQEPAENESEAFDEPEVQEPIAEPVVAHAVSVGETASQEANVTLALLATPVTRQNMVNLVAPVPPVRETIYAELTTLAGTPSVATGRPATRHELSESRLALAPLQDYLAAASRAIHAAEPKATVSTPDSGPRITLPGPTLPPELISLQDAKVVTVLGAQPRPKRGGVPGWVVSLLVMTALLIVGVGLVFYALPMTHPNGDAKAAPSDVQASVAQGSSFPLAQYVEVTGFRIVVDFNKKSEIHYLLVNHSAAEMADMTIYVTLQSAKAKPGQPPLCRFSFRSPNLGPYESKEMTSPIEKLTRSVALPEWADLRAEVQVTQ